MGAEDGNSFIWSGLRATRRIAGLAKTVHGRVQTINSDLPSPSSKCRPINYAVPCLLSGARCPPLRRRDRRSMITVA